MMYSLSVFIVVYHLLNILKNKKKRYVSLKLTQLTNSSFKKKRKQHQSTSTTNISTLFCFALVFCFEHCNISCINSDLTNIASEKVYVNIGRIWPGIKKNYILANVKRPTILNLTNLLIILSGDVEINPGPIRRDLSNVCPSCNRTVAKNHRAVQCDNCDSWNHIKCEGISPVQYKCMINSSDDDNFTFFCASCHRNALPFHDVSFAESDIDCEPVVDEETLNQHCLNINNEKGIKMAHLNINGIISKIDFLKVFISNNNFDIISLNETKIDMSTNDSEISIPQYVVFRKDRDRHGGGVLIYVHEHLSSKKLAHLAHKDFESLWVEIKIKSSHSIFVNTTYRPPRHGKDIEQITNLCSYFEKCFQSLPGKNSEIFILGDLNCNLLKRNTLCTILKEFMASSHLSQLIRTPTRVTPSSSTLIDIIMTNSPCVRLAGVFEIGISDHDLIYVIRKSGKKRGGHKSITKRSFKNFNDINFLSSLRLLDWNRLWPVTDVQKACDIFNSLVLSVVKKHAPLGTHRVSTKKPQWVNEEFLKAVKERDYFKKVAADSKSVSDWDNFKKKRNSVNRLKSKLKSSFYNNKLREEKSNPKRLWNTIKDLLHSKDNTAEIRSVKSNEGIVVTDNKEIANNFNNFFVTIGSTLAKNFSSSTTDINVPTINNTFNFKRITPSKVSKILLSLKNGKATGIDGLCVRILKAGAPELCHPLAYLYNLSLASGVVPTCWKTKRVSPLHKGGDLDDINNYRPISILPVSMKIFEKLV